MQCDPSIPPELFADLAERGWGVLENFVNAERCRGLVAEIDRLRREQRMRTAGVGRKGERRLRSEVRGDSIFWLDRFGLNAATEPVWRALETLQQALNRSLYLGLRHFEAHLTHYPPGAFYQKHRDQFEGEGARCLSAILYLNEEWRSKDGGALRIHTLEGPEDIAPRAGRLVLFVSEEIYHEVLPTHRERLSLTLWFRTDEGLL